MHVQFFSSCHVVARNFHGEIRSNFEIVERDEDTPTNSQSSDTSSIPQINLGKKQKVTDKNHEKSEEWLNFKTYKIKFSLFYSCCYGYR